MGVVMMDGWMMENLTFCSVSFFCFFFVLFVLYLTVEKKGNGKKGKMKFFFLSYPLDEWINEWKNQIKSNETRFDVVVVVIIDESKKNKKICGHPKKNNPNRIDWFIYEWWNIGLIRSRKKNIDTRIMWLKKKTEMQ